MKAREQEIDDSVTTVSIRKIVICDSTSVLSLLFT